jgi:hypothetical protein
MVHVSIRHAEPSDTEAIHRILSGPRAVEGTLQLPLQSLEGVRKRFSEAPEALPSGGPRGRRGRRSPRSGNVPNPVAPTARG